MPVTNRKASLLPLIVVTVVAAALPQVTVRLRAEAAATDKRWDAVAPGRVEPLSREVRIAAAMGRISEVLVKANDKVFPGELMVRLDDSEAAARVAVAAEQVAMHRRTRNDASTPRGSAERRKSEDAVADAERMVSQARSALDAATIGRRAGTTSQENLDAARAALARAQELLLRQQDWLRTVKAAPGTAFPSRLEGELNVARAELTLAETLLEKTRIRAPFAGTVLQVLAKPGELAVPSAEQPLLSLGDLSALRVRAELDERDLAKIRVGQQVLIRADAFRDREFEGKVAAIDPIVGPGRISARGSRKFSDVDVVQVLIDLGDSAPLVVGMQVDVYFAAPGSERQGSR